MSETYNSQLDAQNEMHELAKIGSLEYYDQDAKEEALLEHWAAIDEERGE